jgi:hypothetical protein
MNKKVFGLAVLASIGALMVVAQDPATDPKVDVIKKALAGDSAAGNGRVGSTSIFLVVRVGQGQDKDGKSDTISKDELKRIIGNAIKDTNSEGTLDVRDLSPSVFRDLNRIMNNSGAAAWRTEFDGVAVSQAQIEEREVLLIKVPSTKHQVKQMDITTDKSKEPLVYTFNDKDESKRLVRVAADVYSIPWELNKVISDMKIQMLKEGVEQPAITKNFRGLASDRHYGVSIRNFKGDIKKLYKSIQSEDTNGNQIEIGDGVQEYIVQLATFGESAVIGVPALGERNEYYARIARPSKGKVTRSWSLFPLTKEQAETEVAKYSGKNPEEVMDILRKSNYSAVSTTKDAATLTGDPQWFEFNFNATKDLERAIVLTDLPKLLEKHKDGFYRVNIHELDVVGEDGRLKRREAIRTDKGYVYSEKIEGLSKVIEEKSKLTKKTGTN